MPVTLTRKPDPKLLQRLSGSKSMKSLQKAIKSWVPRDFTCTEGSTADTMAFPPGLFSDLQQKDVLLLQQTFGISDSSKYSVWATHYLHMNVFYGRSKNLKMARKLSESLQSIPVKGTSTLPKSLCLFLATYAAMKQNDSEWRADVGNIIKGDTKRHARKIRRVIKSAEQISEYLEYAPKQIRHGRPLDRLTTTGAIAGWTSRTRLLHLLTKLQEMVSNDPTVRMQLPRLREDKIQLIYAAWKAIKILADNQQTTQKGDEVASGIMQIIGIEIKPRSAAAILRRANNPP